MNRRYTSILINEIPDDLRFEGYFWYSNQTKPEIRDNSLIEQQWFSELPFVVEANFYNREEGISIQIRHLDGVYHAARIDLSGLDQEHFSHQEYRGHDLEGRNYRVVNAWEPHPDPLCAGMEVLVPTWTVFAGFITPNPS